MKTKKSFKEVLAKFLEIFVFCSVILVFTGILGFVFCSCVSNSNCPYQIYLEERNFESSNNDFILKFCIKNKNIRKIKNFTIELSLYDGEGEPVFSDENFIFTFENANLEYLQEKDFEINLTNMIENSLSENEYFTLDYFFLNKIEFDDGTFWLDEIGTFSEW